MAVHATDRAGVGTAFNGHFVDQIAMAPEAVRLQDLAVFGCDLDWLVEVLERKRLGMIPAVLCFGEVLAKEFLGEVAIHASGSRMVARLLPGVELWPHDVAVRTGRGVSAEIGQPLTVVPRESANTKQNSHQYGNQDAARRRSESEWFVESLHSYLPIGDSG